MATERVPVKNGYVVRWEHSAGFGMKNVFASSELDAVERVNLYWSEEGATLPRSTRYVVTQISGPKAGKTCRALVLHDE